MSYSITDKCIGCTLCSKKCPVHAIEGNLKEKHSINRDKCIECGVCGKLCPVSAILNPMKEVCKKVKLSEWAKPIFDYEKCFSCAACKEMCIENCIEMKSEDERKLIYKPFLTDPQICISCGACISVCGVNAIELKK
ncbi:4Fe-4S binding protein [Oceanirhabdus sp. W0125-5]|uniref:4Fe-4S binding protein n=1 Tax=Oceanirhabdus sp. W0125-5 TaxID=2999116 RepID=UPI0022F2D28A|nr:4Fe-4S binding protein [Oceanirhabdus sp. W0125-5]WBW95589.1 4Fe-4S binding protein [Oceanirhabdus sp. W0125-5]